VNPWRAPERVGQTDIANEPAYLERCLRPSPAAGENNAFGLFQFGRKTNLDVLQAGRGQVGLVLQGGW
jgi:hypothetical protein